MEISSNTPPADVEKWHLTGKNPNPPAAEPISYMRWAVEWSLSPNTPLLYKVAAAGLVVLGLAASVISAPAVGLLGCFIVVKFLEQRSQILGDEANRIQKVERAKALVLEQKEALQAMKEAVGGEEAWQAIPILDTGKACGSTGYLSCDIPIWNSIVKGVDAANRPFLALKLRENQGSAFDVTFHQRYTEGGLWVEGSSVDRTFESYAGGGVVNDKARALIHQIVVEKNHPNLRLAGLLF